MKTFATTALIIALHIITSTVCFANSAETNSFIGLVWDDANGNNIMELNEPTIPHITITVQTVDGVTVDQIEVDANGYFVSSQLPHGDYQIWTEVNGQRSAVEQVTIGQVSGSTIVELAVAAQPIPTGAAALHTIVLPLILR